MNWRKAFSLAGLLVLLLAAVPFSAIAAPRTQDALAKVEPLVLDELNTSGRTDYFIWLAEKADLTPAKLLTTKLEKGRFVYETLVATADRTQKDLRAYLDRQGAKYEAFYIANKILVRGGDYALLANVAARADVARVTANHKFQLEQPIMGPDQGQIDAVEPNITFVKAPDVWALGFTGQGTVMAGNDTGLYWSHPALVRQYRGCQDPPTCSVIDHNYNWWDATGTYPNVPDDGHGHGTHTSGTMVGEDASQVNQIGVAPGARLVHCKNMTDGGSGDDGTFTTCFQWDLAPWDLNHSNPRPDLAPDAVNNSWGYWGGGQPQFEDEIAALQAAGTAVEVSAGNEGSSCQTLRSPGDYEQVLTTGSVNHANPYPGLLTGFSSRGPSSLYPSDYFPDVMAPGENIRSSVPGGGYEGGWSGTSMAGPHATALIGLMWSANPALHGQVDLTFQLIKDTAVPLVGQGGSNCGGDYTTGPNNDWGYGTIDDLAAVQAAIAFGGAGILNGTVTDSSTMLPIVGVLVEARHSLGFSWDDMTDASGFYTMTVAAGTYTVTASAYGYYPAIATGVVVITDGTTVQNLALDPAPTYVVSGTVTEAGTGTPLLAQVQAVGAPIPPVWTNPATGYYSITLAAGTYTFHVTAAQHLPADREVVVDQDQTQDFALQTLPCILLVDDDQDGPDVLAYYTDALDSLGYGYAIWDLASQGDPAAGDLAGYHIVIWFTGYPWNSSFTDANETAVAAYLDGGGNFFLSSEDYLYEFGLTPFGQNYLGITSNTNDVDETDVVGNAGNPIGDGLGPYNLTPPTGWGTLYTDYVSGPSSPFSFQGSGQNNSTNSEGNGWKTAFFAWPLEGIAAVSDRADVIAAVVNYFGGCGATGMVTGQVTHAYYGTPIPGASVTAATPPAGAGIDATTDPNGYYTLTLPLGTYDITAQKAGYTTVIVTDVTVVTGTTVVDFQLNSAVAIVAPPSLQTYIAPSGTVTLTLNIDNPGALDLDFEIAETTATLPLRYVGQDVTVHVPAVAARPNAASRTPSVARPARDLTVHVGWISQQEINVLIITPDVVGGGDISLLLSTLAAFPDLVITVWDGNAGTPTVADMQAYDVVFVGNDILWTSSTIDKVALSNNLADYIDVDGRVLIASFIWSYDDWGFGASGRFIYEDYGPYEIASTDIWDPTSLGAFDAGHPIMAGITNVTDNFNHQDPALSPNGTWVASWADGQNFVAVAPNCVGLNQEYFQNADFGGQAGEVIHNALLYLTASAAGDVPWVSESPVSGTVAAGTNMDVDVIFTALPPYNVVGTDYTATLLIAHNDPEFPDDIRIPITMSVVSCMPVYEADFTWAPLSPFAGDTVVFTGTASGDEPITYTWDFGDMSTDVGANVSHVYAAAGTYTVTMTAANACPSEDTVMYQIVVQEQPCPPVEADFTWTPTTPLIDEVVTFDGVATSTAPIVDYAWDLGDMTMANGQTITHTYAATGTYTVIMTATNDCGEFAVVSYDVTVEAPPPCIPVQIITVTQVISGCSATFGALLYGTGPFAYMWDFGPFGTFTQSSPIVDFQATGTYTGTLDVSNCVDAHDTRAFAVTVECTPPVITYTIYLPVVFK